MRELEGRTLFIPEMDYCGSRVLAAAFRRCGVNARVVPPSDSYSRSLGGKCTSGDECYPAKITLGDFLAILDRGVAKPEEAAFFMATADGPCRFGQYADFTRRTLDELGYGNVPVFSLTSADAYHGIGHGFERTAWRGIVASDILRKLLHMTRPYERNRGETDKIFEESVEKVCGVLEEPPHPRPPRPSALGGRGGRAVPLPFGERGIRCFPLPFGERVRVRGSQTLANQMRDLIFVLTSARDRFRAIPTYNKGSFPLIGVVGEIFCRLNTFSNEDLIRKFEQHGAECWLAGVSEWILYTNADEIRRLKEKMGTVPLGKGTVPIFKKMLKAIIKRRILLKDEHELLRPFKLELAGREECPMEEFLTLSLPYLPWYGALGEMTLSAAGAVWFQKKGCAGVVDISPFTCMNGIVSEAVYPKISRDLNNFPIKIFYFDGTSSNLDRDIEIFLELARSTPTPRKPCSTVL